MDKFSYISNADVAAIDNLYQQYQADAESVDFGWKKFFEGFEMGQQKFKKYIFNDSMKDTNFE